MLYGFNQCRRFYFKGNCLTQIVAKEDFGTAQEETGFTENNIIVCMHHVQSMELYVLVNSDGVGE